VKINSGISKDRWNRLRMFMLLSPVIVLATDISNIL